MSLINNCINNVTPAKFCSFLAVKTTNQTINHGVTTQVTFDTEIYDSGSNFASNTFTAPITGLYQFYVLISASRVVDVADLIYINVNGAPAAQTYMQYDTGDIFNAQYIAVALSLNATDTASVNYFNTTTLSTVTIQGQVSPYQTYFGGYRIA